MESISQFATKEDLWKSRCLRMCRALVDIMDTIPDHDIQAETGLPSDRCEEIAEARANAKSIIQGG